MIRSPVSPESPLDGKDGGRAFARIHGYEEGLEVAANQNREKCDLDPVLVLDSEHHHAQNTPVVDLTHGRWREAPQVIDTTAPQAMGDAPLEPTLSNTITKTGSRSSREHDAATVEKGTEDEEAKKEPKRYCGVSLKVFLLILLLIILLIAAIIGGAVGGTQARKNRTSSSPLASPSNLSSPTTTSSSSTSTPSPSPHVRFRLQTYEQKSFQGSSQLFTEPGLFRPAFPIASYIWINSKQGDLQDPTPLLRCSFGFCANGTLNGWRGASDARRTGEEANFKMDTNFIVIGCDLVYAEPDCRAEGLGEVEASRTVATVPVMETPGGNVDAPGEVSTTGTGSVKTGSVTAQVTVGASTMSRSGSAGAQTTGKASTSASTGTSSSRSSEETASSSRSR